MAQDVRKTLEDMAYIGVGILVVGVQQLQIRARDAGSNVSACVDGATTRIGHHTAPVQDRATAAFVQASASASGFKDQAAASTAGFRAQADGLKQQAGALKEQASLLMEQADGLKHQATALKQQAVALGADAYTRVGDAASGARQSVGPMVDDVRRRAEPVVVQLQAAVPEHLQAASGQIQAVPGLVGDAINTGRDRVRSLIRTGDADTAGGADVAGD